MVNYLIKRKLRSALRRLFPDIPQVLVKYKFLGREFAVRDGAIREKPDYDDAWLYFLGSKVESVFDIGSNVGQAALLLYASNKNLKLLCVDPNPAALSIAAENLIRNNFISKTSFECSFVSDHENQEVNFYTIFEGAAGSMWQEHAVSAAKKNCHFTVNTSTIDKLCDKHGIPNLIKVDVEGAEYLVLNGSRSCLSTGKTFFIIEMHSNPHLPMVENAKIILDLCVIYGYRVWYLSKKEWIDSPDQVRDRGRCHFLLVPPGKELFPGIETISQSDPIFIKDIQ